jgi:phosphate:Na+ symporter
MTSENEHEQDEMETSSKPKPLFNMQAVILSIVIGLVWYGFLSVSDGWSIDVSSMLVSFLVGLAFFLYGMGQMENSLDRLAGAKMKSLLQKATNTKLTGVATGAITTILVGSSSITAVLLLNLVGTSALSLARSLPVILGSNIGSTLTIQILAFNLDALVPCSF